MPYAAAAANRPVGSLGSSPHLLSGLAGQVTRAGQQNASMYNPGYAQQQTSGVQLIPQQQIQQLQQQRLSQMQQTRDQFQAPQQQQQQEQLLQQQLQQQRLAQQQQMQQRQGGIASQLGGLAQRAAQLGSQSYRPIVQQPSFRPGSESYNAMEQRLQAEAPGLNREAVSQGAQDFTNQFNQQQMQQAQQFARQWQGSGLSKPLPGQATGEGQLQNPYARYQQTQRQQQIAQPTQVVNPWQQRQFGGGFGVSQGATPQNRPGFGWGNNSALTSRAFGLGGVGR